MLIAKDFPTRIWIEPTNHCNLRCPFCPYPKMKRNKGFMSFEDFKKLADEISGHKLDEFWLQHFGESTLNRDLVRMIRYADEKKIYPILLSTNCTTLDLTLSEEILRSGLDYLVLSLDGASQKTFERIRVGADYMKVVENIRGIFLKKKELGVVYPVLVLQIVYSDETQDEIRDYLKQWAAYLTKNDQISLKEYNDFAGQVEIKVPKKHDFAVMPCRVFFENLVIYWNGDAAPCCLDVEGVLKVGNVFESSIGEVWNSERFRAFRGAVSHKTYEGLELCRKCTQGTGRPLKVFIRKEEK